MSFINNQSIVKTIWTNSDTVLFIFAGAAAEFAVNKSVDWLFYTNKLPDNPLQRLFSTVEYARQILLSDEKEALQAIDTISKIHKSVEEKRGYAIPNTAYLDVLYLLIYYSIVAYECLNRPLTTAEKNEIYAVFYAIGVRMNLENLPPNYCQWLVDREIHLHQNMENSNYTKLLYQSYKKSLGACRYALVIEIQKMLVPAPIAKLLGWKQKSKIKLLVKGYAKIKKYHFAYVLKSWLLPTAYKAQIYRIDNKFCPFKKSKIKK